jgi:plasmid stabilization system protein ParE
MTEVSLFYESASPGLGHDFLEDLRRVLDNVCAHPAVGEEIGRGMRRALLRRFPFSLIYAAEPDAILVVAIAHQRRRPGYWQDRIGR